MKKKKAKSSSKNMYDTFSITMELERPLLYNEEDYTEKKREEEIKQKKREEIGTTQSVAYPKRVKKKKRSRGRSPIKREVRVGSQEEE